MNRKGRLVLAGVAVLVVATALFAVFQDPFRGFEASLTVATLHLIGITHLNAVFGTSILIFPAHHAPIRAVITPACSALGPLLALGALGLLRPRASVQRRVVGIAAAIGIVFVGNIVRIGSVLAVGYADGRSDLVLFHNWVGSAFAFLYMVAGFLVYLWILLPARGKDGERSISALAA